MGDDEWGNKYRENLQTLSVSTDYVGIASGKTTGLAQINVAENGDNQIVIVPGANDTIVPADVDKVQEVLDASKVWPIVNDCIFLFRRLECKIYLP